MDSKSKNRARAADLISELPDALLCHILSFLPTTCAVRTTVLSKRWIDIWTYVPNLDFDHERDFGCTRFYNYRRSRHLMRFVDRVLFFRDSRTNIQMFRLKANVPEDFSRIDAWICTTIRRNVVELDLDISTDYSETFEFPSSVFKCKTLEVLKLFESRDCNITFAPPASGCFPSLESLHVGVHQPDMHSMEKLFSYCPVLEHLAIDGFLERDGVYNFKVYAPQLKTLRINLEEWDNGASNFYINAPRLESIDLEGVTLLNYSLENAESLVNAKIAFSCVFEIEKYSCIPNIAVPLLAGISNVEHLHLTAYRFEALYLPAFHNLKHLKLVLYKCNYWELLGVVLDKSPTLEGLGIEDRTKPDKIHSKRRWNPPEAVPNCFAHLKTISIWGFRGRKAEMKVAKYLLKNGHVLHKMTLHATEELNNELFMVQRASATCQIEVIKMQL